MKNSDLHGNAPDQCKVALLLVDVINDLEFPEADQLLEAALAAAQKMAKLADRARRLKIPVIYANDNFGRWRSDLQAVIRHCLDNDVRGRPIAKLLRPRETDYLVLKPKHSAFFATTLQTLLRYLGVEKVVLAGYAGNICVLFTANDLYLRDYTLHVPRDCTASNSVADNAYALEQMAKILKADLTPSTELDLEKLIGRRRKSARKTARKRRGQRT